MTNSEILSQIPECPVFKPTEKEFEDPYSFIRSIREEGEKAGICKIIPPEGWKPPFCLSKDFEFTTKKQDLGTLAAESRARDSFFESLGKFLAIQGTPMKRPPTLGKKKLDLYKFFRLVSEKGGYENVCEEKLWLDIGQSLKLNPRGFGSLTYSLRSSYEKYLLKYEKHFGRKSIIDLNYQSQLYESEEPPLKNEIPPETETKEMHESPTKKLKVENINDTTELTPIISQNPSTENTLIPDQDTKPLEAMELQDTNEIINTNVQTEPNTTETQSPEKKRSFSQMEETNKRKKKKKEPSETDAYVCAKCKSPDGEDSMLLCDSCDVGYHLYCLDPPLTEIPKYDFFCPDCLASSNRDYGYDTGFTYTLSSFKKLADDFYRGWFEDKVESLQQIKPEYIEEEFWNLVEDSSEELIVEYGSDVLGTAFPEKESDEIYGKSPWSLRNLPVLQRSIFSHLNDNQISGVTMPWLYVGMTFSSFCWHTEDHYCYSINYNWKGAAKQWYGVPASNAKKFEKTIINTAPELFEAQPDLLTQLVTMISPCTLIEQEVSCVKAIQQENEFIITFPRAYHAGFNHGFNFAEAVNFAPVDWFPIGRKCLKRYKKLSKGSIFAHNRMAWLVATQDESYISSMWLLPELKLMLEAEKEAREKFQKVGLHKLQEVTEDRDISRNDRECLVCNSALYFHAVTCSCFQQNHLHEENCTEKKNASDSDQEIDIMNSSSEDADIKKEEIAENFEPMNLDTDSSIDNNEANTPQLTEGYKMKKQKTEPEVLYACVEHFETMCKCPMEEKTLLYFHSIQDIENLVKNLEFRTTAPTRWLQDKKKLFENKRPTIVKVKELLKQAKEFQTDLPEIEELKNMTKTAIENGKMLKKYIVQVKSPRTRKYFTTEKILSVDELKDILDGCEDFPIESQDESELKSIFRDLQRWKNQALVLIEEMKNLQNDDAKIPNRISTLISKAETFNVYFEELEVLKNLKLILSWISRFNEVFAQKKISWDSFKTLVRMAKEIAVPENLEQYQILSTLNEKALDLKSRVNTALDDPQPLDQVSKILAETACLRVQIDQTKFLKKEFERAVDVQKKIFSLLSQEIKNLEDIETIIYEYDNLEMFIDPAYEKYVQNLKIQEQQAQEWLKTVKLLLFTGENASNDSSLRQIFREKERNKLFLQSKKVNRNGEDLYCLCRSTTQGYMIQCDVCGDWYHGKCVDISKKAPHKGFYSCTTCCITNRPQVDDVKELLDIELNIHISDYDFLKQMVTDVENWENSAVDILESNGDELEVLKKIFAEGELLEFSTDVRQRLIYQMYILTGLEWKEQILPHLEIAKTYVDQIKNNPEELKNLSDEEIEVDLDEIFDLIEEGNDLLCESEEIAELKEKFESYYHIIDDHLSEMDEQPYCICRKPSRGFMLACDQCNEWYHLKCVSVSKKQAEGMENYVCFACSSEDDDEELFPIYSNTDSIQLSLSSDIDLGLENNSQKEQRTIFSIIKLSENTSNPDLEQKIFQSPFSQAPIRFEEQTVQIPKAVAPHPNILEASKNFLKSNKNNTIENKKNNETEEDQNIKKIENSLMVVEKESQLNEVYKDGLSKEQIETSEPIIEDETIKDVIQEGIIDSPKEESSQGKELNEKYEVETEQIKNEDIVELNFPEKAETNELEQNTGTDVRIKEEESPIESDTQEIKDNETSEIEDTTKQIEEDEEIECHVITTEGNNISDAEIFSAEESQDFETNDMEQITIIVEDSLEVPENDTILNSENEELIENVEEDVDIGEEELIENVEEEFQGVVEELQDAGEEEVGEVEEIGEEGLIENIKELQDVSEEIEEIEEIAEGLIDSVEELQNVVEEELVPKLIKQDSEESLPNESLPVGIIPEVQEEKDPEVVIKNEETFTSSEISLAVESKEDIKVTIQGTLSDENLAAVTEEPKKEEISEEVSNEIQHNEEPVESSEQIEIENSLEIDEKEQNQVTEGIANEKIEKMEVDTNQNAGESTEAMQDIVPTSGEQPILSDSKNVTDNQNLPKDVVKNSNSGGKTSHIIYQIAQPNSMQNIQHINSETQNVQLPNQGTLTGAQIGDPNQQFSTKHLIGSIEENFLTVSPVSHIDPMGIFNSQTQIDNNYFSEFNQDVVLDNYPSFTNHITDPLNYGFSQNDDIYQISQNQMVSKSVNVLDIFSTDEPLD